MKHRLEDLLIMLLVHAIGTSWACLIVAHRTVEQSKAYLWSLEAKGKWKLKQVASMRSTK